MRKDFDSWIKLKEQIDHTERRIYSKEREIWWCNLGVNIGYEQDGKGENFLRPVLIYKKHNSKIFTAIPLSTKIKENNYLYHKFSFQGKEQSAIVAQARTIDSKRLVNKMGEMSKGQYKGIKEKFLETFS